MREYLVKIRGNLSDQEHHKLMAGTSIDGRRVKPLSAHREPRGRGSSSSWWRVEVTEGRTHEVRELFFRAGHHVQRLRRTAIGPLRDDTLKPGEFRTLSENELRALRKATSKRSVQPGRRGRPGGAQKAPGSKKASSKHAKRVK